jgi:hypothetical protein
MFPAFRDALRSIPTSADPIVAAAIERAAAATIFCETAGGCDDCAVEILHILRIIYGTNQGAASGAAVLALLRKEHSRSHNQHP